MRGISLGLYVGHDDAVFARALAEIAATGANTVSLVVSWSQATVRSNRVAPHPSASVDDAQLGRVARRARELGLQVVLFPILDVRQRGPGLWRGALAPADVDVWWRSYEAFILHYAHIAADLGAVGFAVGSELSTTELWRDRWYHLLGRVDDVYEGTTIYSANWDHYQQVSFWPRVDALGVSAYFELTRNADASVDELTRAWATHRDQLVAFAARVERPLWLTEVGYPSVDGAATEPWNYSRRAAVDLEEQRRCYAALIRTWDGVPELGALLVWSWWGPGGAADSGYTPRNKPAEPLLRSWFGGH